VVKQNAETGMVKAEGDVIKILEMDLNNIYINSLQRQSIKMAYLFYNKSCED
jgi:hypothetical protein